MSYVVNKSIRGYRAWIPATITLRTNEIDAYFMSFPEVVSTRYIDETCHREFVFESEEHYHWFLLKVT